MKVRQLIEALQAKDPDAHVCIWNQDIEQYESDLFLDDNVGYFVTATHAPPEDEKFVVIDAR